MSVGMAYLASLANLGSLNMISFGNFDGSVCFVRKVSFNRNGANFRRFWSGERWRYISVCKYSVTTDFVAEHGTSVSLDSPYEGGKDNKNDALLKPAPKPVLKSESRDNSLPGMSWDESKLGVESNNEKPDRKEEERSQVIESLEEVLEKAEKLETRKTVNVSVNKVAANGTVAQKNGKPVHSLDNSARKSKTVRSVWRKGNPVGTAQTTVKEPGSRTNGSGGAASPPAAPPSPPKPPEKVQPKLQAKPSVAPPAPIRKPVILKDVNATDSGTKTKERKPILIDKFASKKPAVDPVIAQSVLAPPKPGKGPTPGKFKDEFRKRGGPSSAPRRRLVNDDEDAIADEDISELDVTIPGTATARKGRKWSKASRKAARLQAAKDAAPVKMEIMEVGEDGMLTEELAFNLAISEGEILGNLYAKGIKPDGVQKLSKDMVKMVCKEYDVEVIDAAPHRVEEMAKKKEILDEDDLDKLEERPPVLTIMGHVDHGKTTLLDYIRKSKVAASEAGGITQGIGAYKVDINLDGKPQTCVFLDTPGHEAFGAMRARGARVTDIAVIVVAADDGIRPQTNEAIAHAKAAGVPIIVAINKIDKDGANPDRVMQDLSSIGLMPEDWGGDVPMVKISAIKGENVDELLETIMLVAELQELKANPQRNAKGTVIEAGLDKSRGPVATFIVQNGTLKKGDIVVCGEAFGKVRALFDDKGKQVDNVGPSIPVQVIGLSNVPLAGDEFEVVGSLDVAREKAESRADYLRNERITEKAGDGKVTLSSFASAVSAGKSAGLDLHQLNIILKVDVQGSIEAVRQALQVLPQDNITLKFLLQATGDISTSDIDLAVASKAIVFGFNVRAPGSVKSYADNRGVEVRLYKVIYELIDDVRNAMEGLLDPVEDQVQIGLAEVRAVFSSGSGRVAGCMVTEGKIVKDCGIRVIRKGKKVHVGELSSLKRVKETVNEVNAGLECGIGVEGFDEWQEGDSIEAFNMVLKRRTLEEASASMTEALKEAGIQL
ncbi:translation initiation factor IF-2, chloroplastic [Andrographis paniculata]|uniref:translation initiation factor IF-2, chloroplastic n=1 Tax=Andrographis paniculata TaxID=175694 RepID=UPI0021E73386|nr:translation initiation factor IF-2, chloroplastic [Andrographis paniculata]